MERSVLTACSFVVAIYKQKGETLRLPLLY